MWFENKKSEIIVETDLSREFLASLGDAEKLGIFITETVRARHGQPGPFRIEIDWDNIPVGHKEESINALKALLEKVPGRATVRINRIEKEVLAKDNDVEFLSCYEAFDQGVILKETGD